MKNRKSVGELPYIRYDCHRLEEEKISFLNVASKAESAEEVLRARKKFLAEYKAFETYASLCYARYSLNTQDPFYSAEQDYYDEVSPQAESAFSAYAQAMLDSPFRKELEKSLPETVFPLYECAKRSHSTETEEDEREENALVTAYSKLMASVLCDWRGEKKTIGFVRGYFGDDDREIRKRATCAVGKALALHGEELDEIFDRLVKVRTRIARKLGFASFTELAYFRMQRIDYDKDMVSAFRDNVKTNLVPLVCEMKKALQEKYNLDRFYFYDDGICGVPDPKPVPNGDAILQKAREMYADMAKETGDLMEEMMQTKAFDTESREGKWGGGYCTYFPLFRQPFILANFNGTSSDIDVVTHEFGHALAMDFVATYGEEEADIGTNETAETHSMSMEFLCWKYMDKFFDKPNDYKQKHLFEALSFIPYGTLIDEFQHLVYDHPDMTKKERNDLYLTLEQKYRPYLTYDGIDYLEKGTRWQYQMHVFETPFYYIDYCLAQTVALEFLIASQIDYQDALSRYLAHAKRGGMYPFNQLVRLAGFVSPFQEGALGDICTKTASIYGKLRL